VSLANGRKANGRKLVLTFLFPAVAFIGLFPFSMRLADPVFTHRFHAEWEHPVLLVWPDHVEIRWFQNLAEVSPRPKDSAYTFNLAPERQAWVENEVRKTPSPNRNASWIIQVKQLGPSRQRIQLELFGDGLRGIIYEAGADEILPLRSRLTGPFGSIAFVAVDLLLCLGAWLLATFVVRLFHRIGATT
jgi:hypothetical protein